MGVTETFMGEASFTIPIRPDAKRTVLRDLDLDARLWDTIYITPTHLPLHAVGADAIKASARFAGVLLEIGEDGSLEGDGLEWWWGNSGDGGSLTVGADATKTGKDFEAHLDDDFFGASNAISNGIGKGTVDADATTFSFKEEGGDTPREILDTLCGIAPGGPYVWRLRNDDGTWVVDADDQATLFPSTADPTVILAERSGRDANLVGFETSLRVRGRNGREVRTGIYVDWQDGVNNGTSFPTLPAAYTSYDGSSPRVRHLMDWRPKRPKPPTERWRKVAAWRIASQARANKIAANEANERTSVRLELTAEVEVHDPHRYDITPGNTVYLWFPGERIFDTATQVPFRGRPVFPTTGRIDQMDWPIVGGVYVSSWSGGTETLTDITEIVEPEEGPVVLHMGTRDRFPIRQVRAKTLTPRDKRRVRNRSHQEAKLAKYLDRVGRR